MNCQNFSNMMDFTKLIVKIYIQHFLYPTSNSCEQCQLLSNRVKYQQNLDIYTKFIHSYIWHERMRRIKANEVNFNSIQSLYLCWVNFLVLMPVRFSTYLWLPQERRSQAISHGDTESINLFVFFYSFPDWNGQGPGQPSPSRSQWSLQPKPMIMFGMAGSNRSECRPGRL
jgi:hypothetical protein